MGSKYEKKLRKNVDRRRMHKVEIEEVVIRMEHITHTLNRFNNHVSIKDKKKRRKKNIGG